MSVDAAFANRQYETVLRAFCRQLGDQTLPFIERAIASLEVTGPDLALHMWRELRRVALSRSPHNRSLHIH